MTSSASQLGNVQCGILVDIPLCIWKPWYYRYESTHGILYSLLVGIHATEVIFHLLILKYKRCIEIDIDVIGSCTEINDDTLKFGWLEYNPHSFILRQRLGNMPPNFESVLKKINFWILIKSMVTDYTSLQHTCKKEGILVAGSAPWHWNILT